MASKYARVSQVSKRLCKLDNKVGYDMYDNVVDLSFLMKMDLNAPGGGVTGERTLMKWCMDAGLISSEYECANCGKQMQLGERHDRNAKYEWRCRSSAKGREHECKRSVRKGSWFSNSRLDIKQILLMTYMWVSELPPGFVMRELKVLDKTVSDWSNLCREVCLETLLRTSEKIGGAGTIVEMDESKFGLDGKWVLGGIERKTGKCFMEVMDDRTEECLLNVLEEYVLPGTAVVSDCWRAYDCPEGEVFGHVTVNLNFTDPVSGAWTSQIPGSWKAVKKKLRTRVIEGGIDSHLAEYMWRKRQKAVGGGNRFMDFLDAVISVYPPLTKDDATSDKDMVLVRARVERMKQASLSEQEISSPAVIKTEPQTEPVLDPPQVPESTETTTQYVIKGKRFVNVGYLIESLQKLNDHGGKECNFSDMIVCGETREGWNIGIELSCKVCFTLAVVWMEDPDAKLIKTRPNVSTPLTQPPIFTEEVPLKKCKPHPRKTPTPPPDNPVTSFPASSVFLPQSKEVPKATTKKQYLRYMPIIDPPQTTTFIKQEVDLEASSSTSAPSSSTGLATVELLFYVDQPEGSQMPDAAPSTATSSLESVTVTPDILGGSQSCSSSSLETSTASENIAVTLDMNADGVLPVDLNLVKKEVEDELEFSENQSMDVSDKPGFCLVPMSETSLDRSLTLFASPTSTEIPKASGSASDIKMSSETSRTKTPSKRIRTKTPPTHSETSDSKVPKKTLTVALHPQEISSMTVSELQQLKFSQLALHEKITVKERGRPTPDILLYQPGISNNKKYIRSFNSEWYQQRSWLCGCEVKNALFCFPCLLYGGDAIWTKDGFKNVNRTKEKTEKHDKSKQHIENAVSLMLLGTVSIKEKFSEAYRLSINEHNV